MADTALVEENISTQIVSGTASVDQVDEKQDNNNTNNSTNNGKKDINFRLTVKRISDIDTSRQRFYAEFTLRFTWKADESEYESIKNALKLSNHDLHDWEPDFVPQISFPNGLSVELNKINIGRHPFYTPHILKDGSYEICYHMEVRAFFMVC